MLESFRLHYGRRQKTAEALVEGYRLKKLTYFLEPLPYGIGSRLINFNNNNFGVLTSENHDILVSRPIVVA